MAIVLMEPGRVEPVMLRRRAEIPDMRIAAAGEERVARELVARPIADDGARHVADVVLVEDEQRAQVRFGERLSRAAQAIAMEATEIDALFEIDRARSQRQNR